MKFRLHMVTPRGPSSVSGHHLVPGAENMLRPQCLGLGVIKALGQFLFQCLASSRSWCRKYFQATISGGGGGGGGGR